MIAMVAFTIVLPGPNVVRYFAEEGWSTRSRLDINLPISQRDLHDTYFPAFKAAVQEAKIDWIECGISTLVCPTNFPHPISACHPAGARTLG